MGIASGSISNGVSFHGTSSWAERVTFGNSGNGPRFIDPVLVIDIPGGIPETPYPFDCTSFVPIGTQTVILEGYVKTLSLIHILTLPTNREV